ncbi:MAG: DnaJ domain-containing protein, partial [Verrucomicrobiae bacterium]
MSRQKRDYYEILEVDRSVTEDVLKRSYRKLAVKYHPDKNPGDHEAEGRFKELGEAYDVLMDPQKRAAYDRYGHAAFQQGGMGAAGGFHDPFDLFREVFGAGGGSGGIFDHFFGGGGGGESGRQHGSDLRYDMQITLEE